MGRLNPNLKGFWKTKADIKILKGGRSSSKTYDVAGFSIFLASRYTVKFLCVRQFQNRIEDSVYAILKERIEAFGLLDEFSILKNTITHKTTGSSFHFYGMQRNLPEIKGFFGANVLWIEESEALNKDQWTVIEPTIREEGAECWIVYNPRFTNDFVEDFKHDPANGVVVRHINYDENPFLSDTMRRKIERAKAADYDSYEHTYLGIPRDDDDRVIIKRSWIEAAIDAHKKLGIEITGPRRIGFDVADSGSDLCSMVEMHGITAIHLESWKGKEDELLESCTRVWRRAIDNDAHVNYDSIGVGAGCGSKFKELNDEKGQQASARRVTYSKFNAAGAIDNPDDEYEEGVLNKNYFENAKAQAWWLAADRFRNTYNAVTKGQEFAESDLISISGDLDGIQNLVKELSTPYRKFSKSGKVCVESKDDLAKRGIDSPNDADAFIMATITPQMDYFAEALRMANSQ